jgi:hypothetical protein
MAFLKNIGLVAVIVTAVFGALALFLGLPIALVALVDSTGLPVVLKMTIIIAVLIVAVAAAITIDEKRKGKA